MHVRLGLIVGLLAGCGSKGDSGLSAVPTAPTAGTETTTTGSPPTPGLDIGSMVVEMRFGWDVTVGEVIDSPLDPVSGGPFRAQVVAFLGPWGWDGDTDLPGQPNNWCFVRWEIAGYRDVAGGDPDTWLELRGLDAFDGVTNCGRESVPGADDEVLVSGRYFGGDDPVVALSALDWRFRMGGPVPTSVASVASAFSVIGVEEENFFGSEATGTLFPGTIDGLVYGWTTDDSGAILDGDGEPIPHLASEAAPTGTLEDGLYVNVIPWLIPI